MAAFTITGISIKLLDDIFDGDGPVSKANLAGQSAYAILFFAVGCLLSPVYTVVLFIAAYILGMLRAGSDLFPLGNGFTEAVSLLLLSVIFIPVKIILFALSVMLAIQLYDDIVDYENDYSAGLTNLVGRFGKWESMLTLVLAGTIAIKLDPLRTLLIFVSLPLALIISNYLERKLAE